MVLNSRPQSGVGVMPAAFNVTGDRQELWIPLALTTAQRVNFEKGYLDVYARLKQGVSVTQANIGLRAVARTLTERDPRHNVRRGIRAQPLEESIIGGVRPRLLILLGAVGFVLLIACANVANLLLARGSVRSKEIAIRTAIGAGRARVVRQLLTESVVLALAGGVGGLALAVWGIKLIKALSPDGVPRLDQAQLDGVTVAFTLGIAIASSLLFG